MMMNESNSSHLVFTGDLLPADTDYTLGIGAGAKLLNGGQIWADKIAEYFKNADLSIINLESPIVEAEEAGESGKLSFAGNKGVLGEFKRCDITHANVANNHILEHGVNGFKHTLNLLKEYGITAIGVQKNGSAEVVIRKLPHATVAIAGFNAIPDIDNPDCYCDFSEENVLETLSSKEMQSADIRILIFHWGNEYVHIPSWHQIRFARLCIERGAHLIIGHHPHVIQPIEKYKNGLICYSLGNFLFDMLWSKQVKNGILLRVSVKQAEIQSWHVIPVEFDKNLIVKLSNSGWTEKVLKRSSSKMNSLLSKGEAAYNNYYFKKLKMNRFMARINMKKQFILQFPLLPADYRIVVFKAFYNRIGRLLR